MRRAVLSEAPSRGARAVRIREPCSTGMCGKEEQHGRADSEAENRFRTQQVGGGELAARSYAKSTPEMRRRDGVLEFLLRMEAAGALKFPLDVERGTDTAAHGNGAAACVVGPLV